MKKERKQAAKRAKNIKQIRLKREHDVFMKLGSKIKAYFFTGILVTAPVAMTFYLAYKLIFWVDNLVDKMLPPKFLPETYLPFTVPGLGVIILIGLMILIGMFATGFLGKFFLKLGEWIVYKLPFISSVYSLIKQIFSTFFSNKSQAFNRVVMLEYPRKGLWIMGLASTDTTGEMQKKLPSPMINVFIPTTPNPTSGFLIFVPKSEIIELDISVEDALKFIISGGIVNPEDVQKK